jgi:hypothetical protein
MKQIIYPLLIVFIILLPVSCYYDNEEELYPSLSTTCDTANVTFSTTITTILANNCNSCHSNSQAAANGENIRLENYADVQARASIIAGSVKHQAGFIPMPKNGGKIKPCSITQIDIWIRNGALNN